MTPRQRTIARPVDAEGVAVHSGRIVSLGLRPAPPDSGIVFVRSDLPGRPEIRARLENVNMERLSRMTLLEEGEASVGMIEHLLAALMGLGVTNLRAEIGGPECPIFDGSARDYVEFLHRAGLKDQEPPAPAFRLARPVALITDRVEIVALPAERMRLTFFAEFQHHGLPDQQATFELGRDDFVRDLAPARTFCFYEEIGELRERGLIQGGSPDCAIVLREGKPIQGGFRMQNELARHKLLDLMGDLAVLGAPVKALISARASGHALHHQFVRKLKEELLDG